MLTITLATLLVLALASAASAHTVPKPKPGNRAAIAAIRMVFGARAPLAIRVAWCESRWNVRAVSRTGDYGLFQINRQAHSSWVDFRPSQIFDPVYNSRVAFRLSRDETSWGPWEWSRSCWGHG